MCGVSRGRGDFLTGTGALGAGPRLARSALWKLVDNGVASMNKSGFCKGGGGATGRRNSCSDKSSRFGEVLAPPGGFDNGGGYVGDLTAGDIFELCM